MAAWNVRQSFPDVLAMRVQELVWLYAMQHEQDSERPYAGSQAERSRNSRHPSVTTVSSVVSELSYIHKKIALLQERYAKDKKGGAFAWNSNMASRLSSDSWDSSLPIAGMSRTLNLPTLEATSGEIEFWDLGEVPMDKVSDSDGSFEQDAESLPQKTATAGKGLETSDIDTGFVSEDSCTGGPVVRLRTQPSTLEIEDPIESDRPRPMLSRGLSGISYALESRGMSSYELGLQRSMSNNSVSNGSHHQANSVRSVAFSSEGSIRSFDREDDPPEERTVLSMEGASRSGSALTNSRSSRRSVSLEMLRVPSQESTDGRVEFHMLPIWERRKASGPAREIQFQNNFRPTTRFSRQSSLGHTHHNLLPVTPNSPIRTMWDFASLLLVLYDSVRIPLELLELPDDKFSNAMSWTIRLFWTFDFPLNMVSGFVRVDGIVELRWKRIIRNYARTWMFPDIVMVAVDWVETIIEESAHAGLARLAKTTRSTRAMRVVRLVRVGKIFNLIQLHSFRTKSEQLLILLEIFKILWLLVGFTHVVSCCWYGLGVWYSEYDEQTWLHVSTLDRLNVGNRYLECVQWTLAQFSGGTDTVRPQNFAERLFVVSMLLVGFVLAAAFVSALTSTATKLHLLSSGPAKRLAQLRRYLAQHRISQGLVVRIQRNARHLVFQKQGDLEEENVELLAIISESLKTELKMEIRAPVLTCHPFFQRYLELVPSGMRQLCREAVFLRVATPGDELFRAGEAPVVPEMYFISKGIAVYDRHPHNLAEVWPQEWVAEPVLWTSWIHCGTLNTQTHCRVLAVDAKIFQNIVKTSEKFVDSEAYATDFVSRLNAADELELTDLEMDEVLAAEMFAMRNYKAHKNLMSRSFSDLSQLQRKRADSTFEIRFTADHHVSTGRTADHHTSTGRLPQPQSGTLT